MKRWGLMLKIEFSHCRKFRTGRSVNSRCQVTNRPCAILLVVRDYVVIVKYAKITMWGVTVNK